MHEKPASVVNDLDNKISISTGRNTHIINTILVAALRALLLIWGVPCIAYGAPVVILRVINTNGRFRVSVGPGVGLSRV